MFSLVWKEWHEQRWKLAFGSLILAAFTVIGLRSRIVADQTLLSWVCFLGILLLPVLSSTGLVPAERAEGTLPTLLALPVRRWRVLAAKTILGVILCAGPLIVAAAVGIAMAAGREMSAGAMVVLFARSIAATLSLFAWMLALTICLPSETRAGLLSLGVLIFWILATAGLAWPRTPSQLWVVSPFVFTYSISGALPPVSVIASIALQGAIAVALWIWAASRLGRCAEDRS